jgi:AcrR family transcriptional regulator
VLRGAVEYADAHGLGSLTMRALGQALGVEGMALYKHVANKEDLLAGMVDLVLDEVEPPTPGRDWREELRRGATSTFETLLRHPWACQLVVVEAGGSGPARFRFMNAFLGTLREGGFSVEMAHHSLHVLDIYVQGFALGTVSFPFESEEMPELAVSFMQNLAAADHPYLMEHIQYHLERGIIGEGDFEFGLDLLLDGLEARARAQSKKLLS